MGMDDLTYLDQADLDLDTAPDADVLLPDGYPSKDHHVAPLCDRRRLLEEARHLQCQTFVLPVFIGESCGPGINNGSAADPRWAASILAGCETTPATPAGTLIREP